MVRHQSQQAITEMWSRVCAWQMVKTRLVRERGVFRSDMDVVTFA